MTQLVLASASPARLATLRAAGLDPTVVVSGVDESQLTGLPPAELALQLAELKCAAVAARADMPPDALVLGCDSVLELDGEVWTPRKVLRRLLWLEWALGESALQAMPEESPR